MEAEELRIGNYIIVNDKIQLVCELPLPSNCTAVNTKPIPLTEEMLLNNCGLIKSGVSIWLGCYEIVYSKGFGCWHIILSNGIITKINYLHQLQNFYYGIKQEELPINL